MTYGCRGPAPQPMLHALAPVGYRLLALPAPAAAGIVVMSEAIDMRAPPEG